MTEQIRHIMIVGGGTSGWLVAAYLKNNLPPEVKLSLIESTKIGPIGVGASKTSLSEISFGTFSFGTSCIM